MTTTFNGRPIEITDVDGIDFADAHDFCDAFISEAYWLDTDKELTDDELDELNNDSDLRYEATLARIY